MYDEIILKIMNEMRFVEMDYNVDYCATRSIEVDDNMYSTPCD